MLHDILKILIKHSMSTIQNALYLDTTKGLFIEINEANHKRFLKKKEVTTLPFYYSLYFDNKEIHSSTINGIFYSFNDLTCIIPENTLNAEIHVTIKANYVKQQFNKSHINTDYFDLIEHKDVNIYSRYYTPKVGNCDNDIQFIIKIKDNQPYLFFKELFWLIPKNAFPFHEIFKEPLLFGKNLFCKELDFIKFAEFFNINFKSFTNTDNYNKHLVIFEKKISKIPIKYQFKPYPPNFNLEVNQYEFIHEFNNKLKPLGKFISNCEVTNESCIQLLNPFVNKSSCNEYFDNDLELYNLFCANLGKYTKYSIINSRYVNRTIQKSYVANNLRDTIPTIHYNGNSITLTSPKAINFIFDYVHITLLSLNSF